MNTTLVHSKQKYQQHADTSVPYAQEMLNVARHGYSFQTREVLQRIVVAEQ